MPHIRTAARAIVLHGNRLLVIRYDDAKGSWYTVPGGGQQHGENLETTLVREVTEETGATVRVGPLRFVRECIAGPDSRSLPDDFHQVELYFSCTLDDDGAVRSGGHEPDPSQAAVEWVSLHELKNRVFFPMALIDALERDEPFGYLGAD